MISSHDTTSMRPSTAKNSGHKDGLYFVMWKLDKLAKNELNKGQTTAFKRCSTMSEAKRYRRSLHEFTQLQNRLQQHSHNLSDQRELLRVFMYRFPSQSKDEMDLRVLSSTLPDQTLNMIIYELLKLEVKRIDPKFSMH